VFVRQKLISDWPTRIAMLATFVGICAPAWPAGTSSGDRLPATELLRNVVDGELKAEANDHSHWMYQVREQHRGKEEVRLVVQTSQGELDRLRSVDGRPITPEQEKREDERIDSLLHNRGQQEKRQHAQHEDAQRTERLFKLLPDAVTAQYGQQRGELVEILFAPNPDFHPSSHEASVFHAMEGRIWVNTRANRLVEIQGHLFKTVKFGGGLFGHLDKGGEFQVKQSEVAPAHWEITLMHINMRGKALFFKTIGVEENEVRTNFQRVADNLTLAEAAAKLQKEGDAAASGHTHSGLEQENGDNAMVTEIDRQELKQKMDHPKKFILVEALPPESYHRAHLPGAINLPPDRVRALATELMPRKDFEVIIYCAGPACHASEDVARELSEMG